MKEREINIMEYIVVMIILACIPILELLLDIYYDKKEDEFNE